jgi:hypothetical protein
MLAFVGEAHDGRLGGDRVEGSGASADGEPESEPERRGEVRRLLGAGSSMLSYGIYLRINNCAWWTVNY